MYEVFRVSRLERREHIRIFKIIKKTIYDDSIDILVILR